MTLGELKARLNELSDGGTKDALPVYVFDSQAPRGKVNGFDDYEFEVDRVVHSPRSSISNEHVSIQIGKGFGW